MTEPAEVRETGVQLMSPVSVLVQQEFQKRIFFSNEEIKEK